MLDGKRLLPSFWPSMFWGFFSATLSNMLSATLLDWIGCNYGTEIYQTPADLGLVTVVAYGREYGLANHDVTNNYISRKHNTVMTRSAPHSWITVYRRVRHVVCPTPCTLENCVINPCHALANWQFQGSNDETTWTTSGIHASLLLPP